MEPSPITHIVLPVSAILVAGALSIRFLAKPMRFLKYENIKTLEQIRTLTSKEYEEYVAFSFRKLGYKAKIIGRDQNGEVEVCLTKNGKQQVVRCNAWTGRKVPVGEVRDEGVGGVYAIRTWSLLLDAEWNNHEYIR